MNVHSRTPTLSAHDPRGLPVRRVDYWRTEVDEPVQTRVNRTLHDVAGRAVAQWDPRLWSLHMSDPQTPANLTSVYLLNGQMLRSDSVDAGMQIVLHGVGAHVLFDWDSRGTRRETQHDLLLRPLAVFEEGDSQPRLCVERFMYGQPDTADPTRNQLGQLLRHDDPAGSLLFESFSISGQCSENNRHFTPQPVIPDWPEPIDERARLLEPGEGATTQWRFGPQGQVIEQVDARGHRHFSEFTLDGCLRARHLQLKHQARPRTLVSAIAHNADGQVTQELAGNGVLTALTYRPEDGRLLERSAVKANGAALQLLRYEYDRVGNVLSIEDKALPIRYFANQRIDPVSRFTYDSLYQLSEATGWEAGAASQGPESLDRNDPAALSNYRQRYRYDESGNLLELQHVGMRSGRKLKAARCSNRCLPYRNDVPPTEEQIAAAFDPRGNLRALEAGRSLTWDLRNALRSITPVERASGLNDIEQYVYDGGGQRVRKTRSLQTNSRGVVGEVRYLPGLELRSERGSAEQLQVISAEGGLNVVHVLHWDSAPPTGANDLYRYSHTDHLGSTSLELGEDARIISQETFHPFGETAWSKDSEVSYKTLRYSGKERDATGLYYYGFRYYIPWLQRWVNPDPAGAVDGLNLFRMVRNSPINRQDENGTNSYDVLNQQESYAKKRSIEIIAQGLDSFPAKERDATSEALKLGLDWVTNAEKALSQPSLSLSTRKILTMMFDEQDFSSARDEDSFTSLLLADMRDLKSFMTKLANERSQRIFLVDQMPGMEAMSFNTINDGSFIWMSRSYIERSHRVSYTRTVVHEAAHAMRTHQDPNFVADFMYLNFGDEWNTASEEDMKDYVLLGRLDSAESMRVAPDESKFNPRVLGQYKNAVNTGLEKLGKGPATSPRKRADAYIGHVKVRQNVARRNADSVAVFAMQFGR